MVFERRIRELTLNIRKEIIIKDRDALFFVSLVVLSIKCEEPKFEMNDFAEAERLEAIYFAEPRDIVFDDGAS